MPLRNTPERWGSLAMTFHWVIVGSDPHAVRAGEHRPRACRSAWRSSRRSRGTSRSASRSSALAVLRLLWKLYEPRPFAAAAGGPQGLRALPRAPDAPRPVPAAVRDAADRLGDVVGEELSGQLVQPVHAAELRGAERVAVRSAGGDARACWPGRWWRSRRCTCSARCSTTSSARTTCCAGCCRSSACAEIAMTLNPDSHAAAPTKLCATTARPRRRRARLLRRRRRPPPRCRRPARCGQRIPAKSTLEFEFVQAGAKTTGRFATLRRQRRLRAGRSRDGKDRRLDRHGQRRHARQGA